MLLQTRARPETSTAPRMDGERRAVVRYLCDREVFYFPLWSGERLWARVRDISVYGIGLLLSAPMEIGTDLAIDMRTMNPRLPLALVARVVDVTMQEEGCWIVGCRFLTRPTEEDLLSLL